jgi:hypothetical protein
MHIKKIVFSILILILSFSSYAQTSTPPSGGGDSASDPFLISSLENLYWLSVSNYTTNNFSKGKFFKQINNIDASATANWLGKWIPIGGKTSATTSNDSQAVDNYQFQGSYNGNGFYIDGITVNNTVSGNVLNGFFGKVLNGTIINLKLTNLSITTNSQKTGGLVGYLYNSTIYNCSTSGTITSISNTGSTIGGLVGQNGGTILNSYSTCAVTGSWLQNGGLVGLNQGSLYDCYSNGSVTAPNGIFVGGLVGHNQINPSNIYRTYANSTIIVSASTSNGGYIARVHTGSVPAYNYWNGDLFTNGYGSLNSNTSFFATSKTSAELKVRTNFHSSWDFVNTWGFGSDGYPTLVNKPNTWLGIDTNWNNTANWSLGVPSGNALLAVAPSSTISFSAKNLVYIPAGVSNYPVLTAAATAYSVTIANGASINLKNFALTYNFYFQQSSTNTNTCTWTGTTDASWNTSTNWNPQAVPLTTSEVVIPNTTNKPTCTTAIEIAKLTLDTGATLTIQPTHALKVNGNIVNNGQIIFKSNATGSGLFDTFTGTVTGSGSVQVERYIPAKRAYRFLSPSVTTTTSIKQNWQEDYGTAAGLGTHITGIGGATNGFDATTSNNPSLYSFNNSSGTWAAVTSTLVPNTLTAGTPYRLMVRGDRKIDLTTNTPTLTTTVLRATGALKIGNFTPTLNQTAAGYSFVGNPYQAPVDIKAVLTASTNMSKDVVYYWDPTLNNRGAYVTRTLGDVNQNSVTSSFNQYLQPGQAVFVQKDNTANVPTMIFTENHKSISNSAPGVFRVATTNEMGILRANLKTLIDNQWTTIEGALAIFNSNSSWGATQEDAIKFSNLDEEVSFVQNNTSLAIAMQTNPVSSDELPIKLNNTRYTNYQWQFELGNYSGPTPYLLDTQNNAYTQIDNNTIVPFIVNGQELTRFKIVFQNETLNTPDFNTKVIVYPNPTKVGSGFYITGLSEIKTITVHNFLGQNIPVQTIINGTTVSVKPISSISQGVYIVNITQEAKTVQVKWIVD